MNQTRARKAVFALALAGAIFAGYLSFYRLATGECALAEPCPIFLGYPACWYGFGMFAALAAASLAALVRPAVWPAARRALLVVAAVGAAFAGRYVVPEVSALARDGARYDLGLPSCAYGLIFYAAILVVAWRAKAEAVPVPADERG